LGLPNAALVSISARSGFAFACQHFRSLGLQDRFS
jgi:hypothetical protein